jgi:hypothetical protein
VKDEPDLFGSDAPEAPRPPKARPTTIEVNSILQAALFALRIGEDPRDGAKRLRGEAVRLAELGADPGEVAAAEARVAELDRWAERYCLPKRPKRRRR